MRDRTFRFLLLLALLAGCGDPATPDDGGGMDGDVRDSGSDSGGDAAGLDAGPPPPDCEGDPSGDGTLSGALIAYQTLDLSFTGPSASETDDAPNPFLDFRLQVTFRGPSGEVIDVPGFFDGDGDGGATGTSWRVRFTPPQSGEWTYDVGFRSGDEVAVSLDPSAGSPTGADGGAGRFCVAPPDPSAPGDLAHGLLRYVDAHYLRHLDGTWWIKGGADSPENLLGYAGFDGTTDEPGGTDTTGLTDGLHRYQPHEADWQPGDPDWNGGAGRGIIGALNYLGSEEVNSIYFLPCNLEGDGRDTHPYVAPGDLTHFDLSKLHQWEMVFAHAESLSIALHFVLAETENGNENLHDGGTLGVQRMLYYRELIARFGHHNALFWNIGEENDYGAARQIEFATYIADVDPYDHPTTVHTHVDNPAGQYDALVGDPSFDITSIQLSPTRAGEFTEQWRQRSAAAGRPWAVMLDEIGPAGTGVTDTNADQIRRQTLWPALLSGAGGVEWYFGYHSLPLGGDVRTEDFRTRADMWRFTRIARRFVLDELPFTEMRPDDDLLTQSGEVFVRDARVYAVYLPDASGGANLDLSGVSGDFEVRWFDPRIGAFEGGSAMVVGGGSVDLGSAPSASSEDWVVLVTGDGTGMPPPPSGPTVSGLTLIDADADTAIGPLDDSDVLDLASLRTRNLNVRADVGSGVGSVVFGLDGNPSYRVESTTPYALEGDSAGDYAAWTPAVGSHVLTVTPYAASGGAGMAGPPLTVSFTVR